MSNLSARENANCHGPIHSKAIEGLELFNAGRYFEAHEALEAAWRDKNTGPERDLYRAILQVGVVYLHITRQNYAGAIKVYQRSLKWLALWPETCRGVPVGQLRQDLETAMRALQELGPEHIAEFDLFLLKSIQYSISERP
jgi:predicted metal-dependent hydrolase